MKDEQYTVKAKRKDNGGWVQGYIYGNGLPFPEKTYVGLIGLVEMVTDGVHIEKEVIREIHEVDPESICRFTGLYDNEERRIWENDILMCHGSTDDLVKAAYGEFEVVDIAEQKTTDKVIGWHYEVIPTDALSKCEPFCYSMPLTDWYIEQCEMEVIGNIYDFDKTKISEGQQPVVPETWKKHTINRFLKKV